ncbi:MAG: DNA-directed RNA polymerase subunit A'' [Candidatus Aenigmarchaeota archaeon]|nr:DNA-directed RNA polymerase subunit A'' [Candidatus Aenigmarchaeota archaeon]
MTKKIEDNSLEGVIDKTMDEMLETFPQKLREDVLQYMDEKALPFDKRERIVQKVFQLYRQSLYNPEEAIGIVTAQSLSEPATQMSLDCSEKVIVKRNKAIKIIPIGSFIDLIMENEGRKMINGWEVCDVLGLELYVPSITQNEKIEWRQIKEVSRHPAPETLLEIRTKSGRKIVATDSHSFFVRKNNRIIAVSGAELEAGERIPALSFLPENCIQHLETKQIVGDGKYAKKRLAETLQLNGRLGWLFGAYLAEGNAAKFYVSFSNTDKRFLSQIRDIAKSFGFTFNEYDNNRGFALGHGIRINSKQLSMLMERACGVGAANKKVPDFAFSANADFVSGILRGYFDGDGSVSVERKVIRASSKSSELIDGIALLLTRFGIFARKSRDKQYTLSIPYKHAKAFSKIGFSVGYKGEQLDMLCNLFEKDKDRYEDFIDMVGGFDDIMVSLSRKLNLPARYVNSCTKRQKIGRTALLRHIERFKRASMEKSIDIEKELAVLKRMHESDVVWDEIVSIGRMRPSSSYVYDFSVPGTESFTTFDGIVTHNTMRTYHFAGTAGIQVTLGLPRMIEIFDARREPTTPTMIVYVNRGLQDKEKVKKIAENIKEVKVKNITISVSMDLTESIIRCRMNAKKLKELEIDPKKLPSMMKIRGNKVEVEGDDLIIRTKKKDLRNLHKIKFALLDSRIKGIKGITQAIVLKERNEWVINTLGSNLKKAILIEGVDTDRTTSNNIFEVCEVLGIEAARNAIIHQAAYVMEEQGLNADMRYLMLLADMMTVTGQIRSIGRYGISGGKSSVLVRASFEETKKHLVGASVKGEKDEFRGTIENVMVNQLAPIGTGAFNLVGEIPSIGEEKKEGDRKKEKEIKVKEAKKKGKEE